MGGSNYDNLRQVDEREEDMGMDDYGVSIKEISPKGNIGVS
jgi:hypothetical protein